MQRKPRKAIGRRVSPRSRAQVSEAVDGLASKMAALHGGKWLVTVDHRAGFILIRQRQRDSPAD